MATIKFDLLSLFPNFFDSPLKEGLLGKAVKAGTIDISVTNIRNFATDPHASVDDTPYGGGVGMVMRADILEKALSAVKKENSYVILLDAAGKKLNQKLLVTLSKKKHLILVSGRYEGVDQRFKDLCVDAEVSIGDYVLNGGEAASLVLLEGISRLVPGVLGKAESFAEESFSDFLVEGKQRTLLEYPQYTKPLTFKGKKVPPVLLSGDHDKIKKWRLGQAVEKTEKLRPDLLI